MMDAVASADYVTPEMLAAREKLRARLGVSGTQTGGKGTARRKVKKTSKAIGDDKRLQFTLRSIGAANIPGIEEVQMLKEDGHIISFSNPKVQTAPNANTYVVTGVGEEREITLPEILQQLSAAGIDISKAAADSTPADDTADIPKLVEVFDDVSLKEKSED
ncbi:transcription factor btf3, putative [Theileria equi strain WA]|uniref:Nascent polypeptide-associated complex subunit beta n=1 Tax=Theileria equi strain WA TaxID=1537102 RepID=L0AVR4_THEEQ|nr:transcription factor btf3, putative [Theileria equi strain WA]AFZ78974.1 transcription factor btf3, putative [Theileria equi strain WA]|eukprot:XP_004828640.1 transcription factor btf3, putative [Theileria equi strain WA]